MSDSYPSEERRKGILDKGNSKAKVLRQEGAGSRASVKAWEKAGRLAQA